MNIRSHIYFHMNLKLGPIVKQMLEDPWSAQDFEPDKFSSLLPRPLHAPALIKVCQLADVALSSQAYAWLQHAVLRSHLHH